MRSKPLRSPPLFARHRKPSTRLLAYCRPEARGLIKANSDIIAALADQLVSRGTLLAADIDEIIGDAVAARS